MFSEEDEVDDFMQEIMEERERYAKTKLTKPKKRIDMAVNDTTGEPADIERAIDGIKSTIANKTVKGLIESKRADQYEQVNMNKLKDSDYEKLELEDAGLVGRMKSARTAYVEPKPVVSKNVEAEINFQKTLTECGQFTDKIRDLTIDMTSVGKSEMFDKSDMIMEELKKINKAIFMARQYHLASIV